MKWILALPGGAGSTADLLGGKAEGLATLHRLGLPVPPAFVITTRACRAFLDTGRFPAGLDEELGMAIAGLEAATGRRFGGPDRPLVVSVRSGAAVSMPGMMDTILNLGLTSGTTAALARETGEPGFADDSRRRFVAGFAAATRENPPQDVREQLHMAVAAVFSSWHTPRARTYRELHGIAHDLGTAVVVQAMVFGNRDAHSGSGVAFSRDPTTGAPIPSGEVVFGRQGEDLVSGRFPADPLRVLAEREPQAWHALRDALTVIENHYRDACYAEFTVESGELCLLQVRPGRFTGRAAVRVAVDLADEHLITREEALMRVSPDDLRHARTPRLDNAEVFARGTGACPGVATGRVATSADAAVRMAASGPVVLVRPHTSPLDMHGLAVAAGVVTAVGGPASHAAVVARAMGKPAVVGAGAVDLAEGTLVTIDGAAGEVVLGRARVLAGTEDAHLRRLLAWADRTCGGRPDRDEIARLTAAKAALL
ncbi:pyruvate, phosphate dikinase [Amycolatopsis sp. K13G38]|uniref:Pyruvate, phosphate dikinase n=1 Tax=Amycolatopsis acididurans TaxID=2724524 RepID=A0ABX1J6E0_9PSEU|nr:pyruvate, phosphate dikinase [Amycolatopsis acididurans]NKQ54489.1 pyruvate, phosphate dikinase [Amycolatopsis acididurans]